ncbi:MAG: penicillin-binding protein 2 [Blastocatellia bacterium]|nr:penicillin-binding protein 2 [Blastocatellia bacterium]
MRPRKEPIFDPIDDLRQAGSRLEIIYYVALVIFIILAGRLWYLQVMSRQVFAERAEQNRTRALPIPAQRGTIFDRKGRVLVTSQSSYNIIISREEAIKSFDEIAALLVRDLGIDQDWLSKRFEAAKYEPKHESIVVKELATPADVAWVSAHQWEYPMIRAEKAPRRQYPFGELAAHALGYVGEVDRKELNDPKSPFSKEKGFKFGDIIGKAGIERTYNEILMGKDGERRVIVDSRGRIKGEVDRIEPIPGRNLYTTLDLDIQQAAEAQTTTMPSNRGVIVVADPNNGEIFALVSHPAFDPNIFSLRAKTDTGGREIRELQLDPDKPLYNRVIQGMYAPGSTWKLMTTVAALNEGVITPETRLPGGGIQLGNYFMKSFVNLGMPDVVTAITHSSDGFFYRVGLKMGPERFERWVRIFRFGEQTGIDLPQEVKGRLPTRAYKEQITRNMLMNRKKAQGQQWSDKDEEEVKKAARWTDYDMAASAFGQGTNATTPIQLLRYVNGLAVGGQMTTPHLFLRALPGINHEGEYRPEVVYEDKNKFVVPMSPTIQEVVKKGMWQAVNAGGTAAGTAIVGFDICGKTGTAQVASSDRAGKKTQDNAWFMGFAPRDNPEISMVVLTENSGFGGKQSVPRAKPIFEGYYRRTRGIPEETMADLKSGVRTPDSGVSRQQ